TICVYHRYEIVQVKSFWTASVLFFARAGTRRRKTAPSGSGGGEESAPALSPAFAVVWLAPVELLAALRQYGVKRDAGDVVVVSVDQLGDQKVAFALLRLRCRPLRQQQLARVEAEFAGAVIGPAHCRCSSRRRAASWPLSQAPSTRPDRHQSPQAYSPRSASASA